MACFRIRGNVDPAATAASCNGVCTEPVSDCLFQVSDCLFQMSDCLFQVQLQSVALESGRISDQRGLGRVVLCCAVTVI